MRLILIPPYQNPVIKWGWVLREAVADYKKKGLLEGIEIDVDEGPFVDSAAEHRNEEVLAIVSTGNIQKVREYSETGKYDAIVLTGGLDPGFVAARAASDIPVAGVIHSAVHIASLIGERCSILLATAQGGLIVRHVVERYGLNHKVASVRFCGHTSTEMYKLLSKYKDKKEDRVRVPEIKKIIDDVAAQGIAAIEKERADTFILVAEPFLTFEDEVRRRFDEAGYNEIPIICGVPAAIEMAKAMVNLKLPKAPRAYPSRVLKAKPEYW